MLDPVKNAKVIGYLIILITLLGGVALLPALTSGNLTANSLYVLASTILSLMVAFGLIKSRLWGVYGFGIMTLLALFDVVRVLMAGASPSVGTLAVFAIYAVIFFWLLSAKAKFQS